MNFADTIKALNRLNESKLTEETHRQVLIKDLYYGNTYDFADGYEILNVLTKKDPGKIVDAYRAAGLVTSDGKIIIPAGTKVTYVTTRQWKNTQLKTPRLETYDIYHIAGHKDCVFAINVDDIIEFFGE